MRTSIDELKQFYKEGILTPIARELPYLRGRNDKFIQFLMSSNLLTMHEHLLSPPITLGADPEFILHEKGDKSKMVLFSSQYTGDYFGVSEAEIGADYGLLEFRPNPGNNPRELYDEINRLHELFSKTYDDFCILEKEAVEYNHKRARILKSLQEDKDINYGMNRGKDVGVWQPNDEIVLGTENGMNLSAYNKPTFNQFNDKLYTAGGHIHVGGSLIMMLSIDQLKSFVRKLDKEILPLCESVESEAAELRKTVYGSIGEFRLKDYGVEYRSPSNAIFWKSNSKVLLKVLGKVDEIARNMALT
jgi:hypothetical protein